MPYVTSNDMSHIICEILKIAFYENSSKKTDSVLESTIIVMKRTVLTMLQDITCVVEY